MIDWQSASTIPKEDGIPILVWLDKEMGPCVVSWYQDQEAWETWMNGDPYMLMNGEPFSHWAKINPPGT